MKYLLYCLFITIFIFIGLSIYYKRKYNKQIQYATKQVEENYVKENKQKLESRINQELENLLLARKKAEDNLQELTKAHEDLQTTYNQLNEQLKQYQENGRKWADEINKTYEEDSRKIIDARIAQEKEEKQQAAMDAHVKLMESLGAKATQMQEQIEVLSREIADYSAKQAAINEAILRQRAIDEKQDFYRICLAPETANDVSVLNVARQNLKKPEIIDKIIYDNYISKPVLEMVKRVLQNTTYSGIYKITSLKTGEIYIGKSTDIKARWQQHCKSAFNCGTIAHSLLHTKMKQYGIENFTFEVVEQVPKEQLSEREKFYINFYQTKETGLNERNG